MATKQTPNPKLIVELRDGTPVVIVSNWHGVTNTMMHGIEYRIERAIHEWRAKEKHKVQMAELENRAA